MLTRFFTYYRPHWKLFALDFGCAFILALLELAFPLAAKWIVDSLIPDGRWNVIIWACMGVLAFYVISAFLHFIVMYWGHKLGINIETDMRRQLFQHVQKLSFRFFDNTKTGHIMSRLTNDLFEIGELAHHGPEDFFIAIMTLIGAFIIMMTINVKLALITLITIPLLIWLISVCSVKIEKAASQMFANIADVNAQVEDSVSGIRVVKSFTNEQHEIRKFAVSNNQFRLAKLRSYLIISYSSSGMFFLMRIMSLIVLLCGAWFVVQDEMSIGDLVAFLLFVNVFIKPIEKINALLESYPKGMAGFRRFLEILDVEPDVADAHNAMEASKFRGDITFRDVTFGYEEHTRVLQNIDLHIRAGETIAFVGPSGAGKTTICSLIPRFYEIDSGEIAIDGLDIRKMTQRSLRAQIGIVQQDVFLFTGTIRENISYGRLDATEEEILEAVQRSHMKAFIDALPLGLDTPIGERGIKLSGGQKQRMSIARIFLKNPPILILDEATSALDAETESVIQLAFAELSTNRTTLVIAHRLATIRHADRIVVVTEEGVEEQGTHDELLEHDGVYAKLYRAQFS
jgi:ATP-binding cassette subfamily B protein